MIRDLLFFFFVLLKKIICFYIADNNHNQNVITSPHTQLTTHHHQPPILALTTDTTPHTHPTTPHYQPPILALTSDVTSIVTDSNNVIRFASSPIPINLDKSIIIVDDTEHQWSSGSPLKTDSFEVSLSDNSLNNNSASASTSSVNYNYFNNYNNVPSEGNNSDQSFSGLFFISGPSFALQKR